MLFAGSDKVYTVQPLGKIILFFLKFLNNKIIKPKKKKKPSFHP